MRQGTFFQGLGINSSLIAKTAFLTGFAASVMLVTKPAQAAIVTYTNQADFLNAIQSGSYLETFESVSNTSSTPTPINFSNGTYSYRASTSISVFFGAGTSSDHWLSTDNAGASITFNNFSPTITAIGGFFFASNISGNLTSGTINAQVNGGSASLSTLTNSSTNFFGFVSNDGTPLADLVVTTTQPNSGFVWPTVNNLIVGQASQPVPEPLTILGAMTAAAFGAGFKRKLGKNQKNKKD